MTTHDFTIADLQAKCSQSVSVTYNVDAADTLELAFKPEVYSSLGIEPGHRIVLAESGRVVFSGTVMTGSTHSVQAGGGEDIQVVAVSDLGLLERMAYVMTNSAGEAIYPFNGTNWMEAGEYARTVFNHMAVWPGSPITTAFSASVSDRVPVPEGNGATPAANLLQDALSWVPDGVLVQRYGGESGYTLSVTKSTALEGLSFPHNAPIQQIGLTARPELVPPVCALVGGDTFQFPDGVDVRTPGAFIYPVPVDRDGDSWRSGGRPNSQKMVVRGVPVPERTEFERGSHEYKYSPITEGSDVYKFLSRFFPQYKPLLGACDAGAPVMSIVTRKELEAEAQAEAEANGDDDAADIPANYSDTPQNWSAMEGGNGIYVMTEGSFPASSRATRNLRGLRWCKGSITLMVRLLFKNKEQVPEALREAVPIMLPGKVRYWSENDRQWRSAWIARLTVDATFINRRLRIYDAATAQPCSTDPNYDPNEDDKPTVTDYRAALVAYYNASRAVPFEGNVNLLHDGSLRPEELTGRPLNILGKRPEWENMNAVVRSVTWDYMQRKLSLSVGSRAVLDFDEYLGRRMLAKHSRREATQRMVVPFDVSDPDSKKKRESEMSVSPGVSASVSAAANGRPRKPFTLYDVTTGEGLNQQSVVWLAGGTLYKNGKAYNVPDSDKQFSKGQPTNSGWTWGFKVKLKWEADAAGNLQYTLFQDFT